MPPLMAERAAIFRNYRRRRRVVAASSGLCARELRRAMALMVEEDTGPGITNITHSPYARRY